MPGSDKNDFGGQGGAEGISYISGAPEPRPSLGKSLSVKDRTNEQSKPFSNYNITDMNPYLRFLRTAERTESKTGLVRRFAPNKNYKYEPKSIKSKIISKSGISIVLLNPGPTDASKPVRPCFGLADNFSLLVQKSGFSGEIEFRRNSEKLKQERLAEHANASIDGFGGQGAPLAIPKPIVSNPVRHFAFFKDRKDYKAANRLGFELEGPALTERFKLIDIKGPKRPLIAPKEPQARLDFSCLYKFLELFYLKGEYAQELVEGLKEHEAVILVKLIKGPYVPANRFKRLKENVAKVASEALVGPRRRGKGYKVTNNKRFIYRKVKTIMLSKFEKSVASALPFERDKNKQFFAFYFENQEEYGHLTGRERRELEFVVNEYKEKEIGLVWRFKRFVRDFFVVFDALLEELKASYFPGKLKKYKAYFRSLEDKNISYVMKSRPPLSQLPLSHEAVEEYKRDFLRSFEEHSCSL